MEFLKITFIIALITAFLFIAWAFIRKQGTTVSNLEGKLGNIGLKVFLVSIAITIIVGGFKTCGKEKVGSDNGHYLHSD